MSYDVTIQRCGLSALFDLKGAPDAVRDWVGETLPPLPDRANSRTEKDDAALYHIGRDHWIARAPLDREEALEAQLNPIECPADISIVRVSDTLCFFGIAGPDADEVMAIACPLDLHDTVFGADTVTYTEVFGLKALVQRCEGGFEIAVEQSFGDMVGDYLDRALA